MHNSQTYITKLNVTHIRHSVKANFFDTLYCGYICNAKTDRYLFLIAFQDRKDSQLNIA
jgi:hypothetical protein